MKKFSGLFRAGVRLAVLFLLGGGMLYGQNVGSLQGQVTDPKSLAVGNVAIEVTQSGTGASRTTSTDASGSYSLSQLRPGNYTVTFSRAGFRKVVRENVAILVSTPTTLNVQLVLGEVSETVTVEATLVPALNTTDSTVGNPFAEQQVKSLPFLARNVVNLLTLQPGVVFTGESDTDKLSMGSINSLDERDGAVNGVRGNQTNVTVDGVDANDWQNQAAFTSALPVTLDSVQEFRVTTTGANATEGVAGGAQVALVTKSGSNDFHGNARWYYRTTGATANSFFNNQAGIERPKLQRHIPGGSLGGRIIKDRLFFFLDNEERREASAAPVSPRIVPTDSLRDGVLIYRCANPAGAKCAGGTVKGQSGQSYAVPVGAFGLGPADIQTLDPADLGVNPAMVPYMKLFPRGNDPSAARDNGLNFTGFRFNAPVATSNDVFTARLDFNLTRDARHSIFWRGILGQIKTDLTEAQFPGQPVASTLLNNSRGTVVQYQGQFRPNLINTFRWGFTRLGAEQTGVNGTSFAVRSFDSIENFNARGSGRKVPVHEWKDDVAWVRGTHTFQFGGSVRRIRNSRVDNSTTFPGFFINNGFCQGLCGDAVSALSSNGFPDANSETTFTRAFMMLTGSITQINATGFAQPNGTVLPLGTPERRRFAENDFEVYAQDSWRIRPNLTLTAGLRWGYASPPWETNRAQVRPTVDIMAWFRQRIKNMNAGIPSDASPLLSWALAGKANGKNSWYDPYYKDFAPRLSLAYSPGFSSGLGKAVFGGSGKSSIRLGAGIYYSRVGQALATDSDLNGSPGIATSLINPSQEFCLGPCASGAGMQAPRFGGTCSAAGCTGLPDPAAFLPLPKSVTFPFSPNADTSNLGFVVDPHLRTPYSINLTLSFQRELAKSVVLDVSYVGTLGRRLLGKIDYAQYLNIRDPKSKTDLWSAYRQVASLVGPDFFNPAINPTDFTALSKIKSIPFFDNVTPNMPGFAAAFSCKPSDTACNTAFNSLTPTQAFYSYVLQDLPSGASWSCALFLMDIAGLTGLPSPYNTTVDPQQDGFVLFTPQFSALTGWTNFGNSNFHSFQVSVRKSVGRSVFTVNYVYSKSIDNTSGAENADLNPNGNGIFEGLIQNPFDLRAGRAASDFDLRHNMNANWLVVLPFGHGGRFGAHSGRLLNALIGGWEITGAARWRSGFPLSPEDGFNFPTNFFLETPGTVIGRLSSSVTRNGQGGRPNLFSNATAALAKIAFTGPGLSGSRNAFRSPAFAAADAGVYKSIQMPWSEKQRIQFRVSAFNVFNSVNFATNGVLGGILLDPTAPSTFGQIQSTAGPRGGAREMEFAIRFEF